MLRENHKHNQKNCIKNEGVNGGSGSGLPTAVTIQAVVVKEKSGSRLCQKAEGRESDG